MKKELKKISDARKTLEEAKQHLRNIEQLLKTILTDRVGMVTGNVRIINDKFIIYDCDIWQEFVSCIRYVKPTNTSYVVNHRENINVDCGYRIDVNNIYNNCHLRISFYIYDVLIHINIDPERIPTDFFDKYFYKDFRHICDTEYVYFPGVSIRDIEEIRLPAFYIKSNIIHVKWYKEQHTMTDKDQIMEFIKDII